MFIYSRLQKHINQLQPKTITIDIFDTLLMRRNRAEQWHFWQFSFTAARVLEENHLHCSALLYFSLRNYYNQVLRTANAELGHDYEASLDSVNTAIISDISRRAKNSITTQKTKQLCKKLAQTEIEFEHEHLFVNKKLIAVLRNNPQPIYFVTDMYFTSSQVRQVLKTFGLQYDGISSSDFLYGKSSGRSFERLSEKFPKVTPATNLHIGDHRQADIAIPERIGMQVFWLHLPLHRLRLLCTKYFFGLVVKTVSWFSLRRAYHKSLDQALNAEQAAVSIGTIFAPALIYYLHYLGSISAAKKAKVLFVSSESFALSELYRQLGFRNAAILPDFSRTKLIQSYCYLQHKKGVSYFSLLPMIKKVQRRKTNYDALITLGAITQGSHQYHLAGKRSFKEYLEANDQILTRQLKKVYLQTLHQFKLATKTKNLDTIILADVGWNSTIQILLSEILHDSVYSGGLSGIYLGMTGSNVFSSSIYPNSRGVLFNSLSGVDKYLYQPEVWESFLNTDNLGHPTREQIVESISNTLPLYQESSLSPLDFYRTSRKLLIKTLAAPSRKIIKVFAKLSFDYGTGNESPVPMVDTSHSSLFAYRLLLRDRARFKQFYHDQGWKWGAATWYHFRTLYRLWRVKVKKPSF